MHEKNELKFFSLSPLSPFPLKKGFLFFLLIISFLLPPFSSAEVSLEEVAEHYNQGKFESAVSSGLNAVEALRKRENSPKLLEGLIALSQAYHSLGQNKEALVQLHEALDIANKSNDKRGKASVLSSMGNVSLTLGRLANAEDYLKQGIDLVQGDADSRETLAGLWNRMGNLRMAKEDAPGAVSAYEESMALSEESGSQPLSARVSANCAKAYFSIEQQERAMALLALSLKKHRTLPPSYGKANGLIFVGITSMDMAEKFSATASVLKPIAQQALLEAATVAKEIEDHRSASYALGNRGKLYERARRSEEALRLTREAAFEAQQVDAPESLYQWEWQTGRLLRESGDMDGAIAAYGNAVHTLQFVRQGMESGCSTCGGASFVQSIEPIYFQLADLLLQRSGSLNAPKKREEHLLKARETIELLKTAELRDYFQDSCVDAYQSKITSLDTISRDTAVVYVISLPDRLEVLLSLPSGMKRFMSKVRSEEFTKTVRAFRKRLEKRTTRQYLAHAQKLYNWLIRPMEADLATGKIKTLAIVPDRSLRTVPLAALHDGKNFLIQKYAIATTQGLSLTDPHPMQRKGLDILLAGLTESVQGFPALVGVDEEIEGINALHGGAMLMNKDFIVPNMKHKLAEIPYSVVHIASHGEFSADVGKSFLLTWDEKLTMNQLDKMIRPSRFRKNPVELLALSACQTAAGDDRAALGLAGIAVKAGARSALATLWYISDEASSRLVVEFFKQLKDTSLSKAKALQRAQLKLLSDPRYRHPIYWSFFLLIGNWL